MSKPIKVGIIGTGIFATDSHLPSFQKLSDKYEVVACYNRTKAKAEVFAQKAGIKEAKVYDSIDDLINDPEVEAIDAMVPVAHNLDIVTKVVKAGKALMIEKPIAHNLEDAQKIVKIAENSSDVVMISENWLSHKAFHVVKPLLKKIGNIVAFEYKSVGPFGKNKYSGTGWRQVPQHIGGYLSDGGVHQLAYLVGLLGEAESISAHTVQVREASGADDTWFSTLKMKNGAIGTFSYASSFGAVDKVRSLTIFGDNGSIFFDFSPKLDKKQIKLMIGGPGETPSTETFEVEFDEYDGVVNEMENFYEAVKAHDKSLVRATPAVCYQHLAVVAAALESSEKGGAAVKVV